VKGSPRVVRSTCEFNGGRRAAVGSRGLRVPASTGSSARLRGPSRGPSRPGLQRHPSSAVTSSSIRMSSQNLASRGWLAVSSEHHDDALGSKIATSSLARLPTPFERTRARCSTRRSASRSRHVGGIAEQRGYSAFPAADQVTVHCIELDHDDTKASVVVNQPAGGSGACGDVAGRRSTQPTHCRRKHRFAPSVQRGSVVESPPSWDEAAMVEPEYVWYLPGKQDGGAF
jgi:hypothetical protein